MAGLNDIISNTGQQTTTLPGWFDTAQQNVVSQAGQAANAAPMPQNTVGQNAVNALSGPTNAFTQAGGTLQQIASGAANPWITNPTTGQVTPDTSTAMGGLFQAQNQQLQQMMPNVTAPVDASSIASGNFGSLRGDTAYNKAIGDANANLFAQQNQAALQNQQTGVNAAQGAGTTAQENINNLLTTGQYQQASPFINASNYGKILGGIQAPTTVNNQTQLSPLNQIAGLASVLGGQTGTGGLLGQLLGQPASGTNAATPGMLTSGGLSGLWNSITGANNNNSVMNAVSATPDNSGQYSGSMSTPTSTGGTSYSDIQNAADQAGYSTPIGGDTGA